MNARLLPLVATLLALGAAQQGPSETVVDNPALLQEVLAGNSASRALPGKYRMKYRWTFDMPSLEELGAEAALIADRVDSGSSTLFVDGPRKHLKVFGGGAAKDGTRQQILAEEVFVTESSYAEIHLAPGLVQVCYEWARPTTPERLAEYNSRVAGGFGPNLLLYGLGTGDEYLQDAVLTRPDVLSWRIERQDSGLIRLERHIRGKQPDGIPDSIFTIDPARGHLVVHVQAYDKSGHNWLEIDVVPQQLAGGVWVPRRIQEVRSGIISQFEIEELEFAGTMDAGIFSWAGVDTSLAGYACVRVDADGDAAMLRYDGSAFVPGPAAQE